MSNTQTDADYDETRDADTYDPNPGEDGKWLSAIIALLGLWMIVQALLFDLTASQFWNDVIIGVALAGLGGYNYSRRADERFGNMAAAALAALLGLWLIASPFMFGADGGTTETVNDFGFWNDIIVGLAAAGLGAYSAYKVRDHRETTRRAAAEQ